ncbi:MAG: hypothetical protein JNL53_08125 [Cyclobacteriaceae bacterium]|nr:hypothetical protein [Cyclobacteriaceae bacterium]
MKKTWANYREYEVQFFRAIKKELNFRSTQQLVNAVRLVGTSIRKGTDPSRLALILNYLPDTVRWILVGNEQKLESHKAIRHLDELVENVYAEDSRSENRMFKNEIDALKSTLVIVKYFTDLFDKLNVNIFPYPLCCECQQAVAGDPI